MSTKGKIVTAIIVILILSGIGFVFAFWAYPKVIKPYLNKNSTVVEVTEYPNGLISTSREWVFSPDNFKGVISEVANNETAGTRSVPMLLADNMYFYVPIPDGDYEWDYGKTLWMLDGSVRVRVMGGVSDITLAKFAGIDNPRNLGSNDSYLIASPEDKEGVKSIAAIIKNTSYAIVVDIYSDVKGYFNRVVSDIDKGLSKQVHAKNSSYAQLDNTLRYESLPADNGKYQPTVKFDKLSLKLDSYLFKEGSMYAIGVTQNFSKVVRDYTAFFEVMSGAKIYNYYNDDKIFYATGGEYSIGIVQYNSNSSILLIGRGLEARTNILSILKGLS